MICEFDIASRISALESVGIIEAMNLWCLVLAATGLCAPSLAADAQSTRPFPPHFQFGAATASYQIEGGWNESGKGENIWDRLTHGRPELIVDGSSGDVACDSYHNYGRDVEMLAELGVDFYRFSLSWARILPTGRANSINPDGLRYYNALIDELLANGIEPRVTLYHWDLPQVLQDLGGWTNPLMADYFVEYARVVFDSFGDRVKMWLTFNEPMIVCLNGYGDGSDLAPALKLRGSGEYLCAHTILKAHARVYRMYDEEYRKTQKGKISLTLNAEWSQPAEGTDPKYAEKALQFDLGWFAHPIFSAHGDYPDIMKEAIHEKSLEQGYNKSRLPEFTREEVEYIRGTYDFFGLNHYSTNLIKPKLGPANWVPSFDDDRGLDYFKDPAWPGAASGWLKVVPWGFKNILGWIRRSYGNPELIVFENGYSDRGGLVDEMRTKYYHQYLNALMDALEDGSNIVGYTAWSLMDNYEWNSGYTERFGIYSVDFEDPHRVRKPKMSAVYYSEVIRKKAIEEDFTDELTNVLEVIMKNNFN